MTKTQTILATLTCAGGLALAAPAHADGHVGISVQIGTPYVVVPAPVVYPYGYRPHVGYYRWHPYWRHYYRDNGYRYPHYRPQPYPSYPRDKWHYADPGRRHR